MKMSRLLKLSRELKDLGRHFAESDRYQRVQGEIIRLVGALARALGENRVLDLIERAPLASVVDEQAVLSLLPSCRREIAEIVRLSVVLSCEEIKRGGLLEALYRVAQDRNALILVPAYLSGYLPAYIAERAIFFRCEER